MFSKNFFRKTLVNAIFKTGTKHKITGFAIDSRLVQQNDVFIALKGEHVDGHLFISDALKRGASAIIIQKEKEGYVQEIDASLLHNTLVILVDDPLQALVCLAKAWRSRFSYPVVAITGSLGKTTTKDMVVNMCKTAQLPLLFSEKNQNTFLSLCVNILKMRHTHKAVVFEVGIDGVGQMEMKADILRPTVAVITCIAQSHTQFLGALKQVAYEKKKIFSFFDDTNIGIINGDQLVLRDTFKHKVIRFGNKKKNDVQAQNITMPTFMLKICDKKRKVRLRVEHRGFVTNALAASSVAHVLGISLDDMVKGLETFVASDRRFEKKQIVRNRGVIISDCYNANPVSMKAAIQAFHGMRCAGKKIAVLGDMKELGGREIFWHRQIGRYLQKHHLVDYLVLVGELAKEIACAAPQHMHVSFVRDWQEAVRNVDILLGESKDSLVLVKGSLSVNLGCLVKELSN
jgi:UDP-N-acetylmuramoyl-tripeptide--D-alanyl-D-alanine ligase